MKVAVVGLGCIGAVHVDVLRRAGHTVAAVCDIRADKCARYPFAAPFTDYERMLDECKPEAVHICTPHYLHAPMVVAALQRNVHVLCEKPLCIRREEIDEILTAAQNSEAQLGVCHQNRYNAANVFVKEYLQGKKCVEGTASVVWRRDAEYYRSGEWRGKRRTEGGGVLINQALHTLDLLQWFAGYPSYVTAQVANLTLVSEIEVEDTAFAVFGGGADFTFFATNGGGGHMPVELTLQADGECIKILPDKVLTGNTLHTFSPDTRLFGKYCYGTGHERLISDFYDCVQTGGKFPIDGEEGAKVVRLILGAYESNGKKVPVIQNRSL